MSLSVPYWKYYSSRFLHFILLNIGNSLWKYSLTFDQKWGKWHKVKSNYKSAFWSALYNPTGTSEHHVRQALATVIHLADIWTTVSRLSPHYPCVPTIFLFQRLFLILCLYRNKECQRKRKSEQSKQLLFLIKLIPPPCRYWLYLSQSLCTLHAPCSTTFLPLLLINPKIKWENTFHLLKQRSQIPYWRCV